MKRPTRTQGTSLEPRGAVVVPFVDVVGAGRARELAERGKRLSWLRRKALMRSWRSPAGDRGSGVQTPR